MDIVGGICLGAGSLGRQKVSSPWMGCVQMCREDLWGSRGPSIPVVPPPQP